MFLNKLLLGIVICSQLTHPSDIPLKLLGSENFLPPSFYEVKKGKLEFTQRINLPRGIYTLVLYLNDYDAVMRNYYSSSFKLNYSLEDNKEVRSIEYIKSDTSFNRYLFNINNNVYGFISGKYESKKEVYLSFYLLGESRSINIDSFYLDIGEQEGEISLVQMYQGNYKSSYSKSEYDSSLNLDNINIFDSPQLIELTLDYQRWNEHSFTINQLKNNVKCYSYIDNSFLEVEIVEDNYSGNEYILNTPLDVIFKSEDSLGNINSIKYVITVVDRTSPLIEQLEEVINISYKDELNKENLSKYFKFSDNYDKKECIIDYQIEDNSKTIGLKNLRVTCIDSSLNKSIYDTFINVIDDIKPVINGGKYISTYRSLSKNEILSFYNYEDEIDKDDCVLELKAEEYLNNNEELGEHKILITCTDKSKNKSSKTAYIDVKNSSNTPIFIVDSNYITSYGNQVISPLDLVKGLIINGKIESKEYTYAEYIGGNYPYYKDSVEVGNYKALIQLYSLEGDISSIEVDIEVKEELKGEDENLNFFEIIGRFFMNLFNKIVEFFKNLFKI